MNFVTLAAKYRAYTKIDEVCSLCEKLGINPDDYEKNIYNNNYFSDLNKQEYEKILLNMKPNTVIGVKEIENNTAYKNNCYASYAYCGDNDDINVTFKFLENGEMTILPKPHQYKFVGYDPQSGMITVVNPHYSNTYITVPKEVFIESFNVALPKEAYANLS